MNHLLYTINCNFQLQKIYKSYKFLTKIPNYKTSSHQLKLKHEMITTHSFSTEIINYLQPRLLIMIMKTHTHKSKIGTLNYNLRKIKILTKTSCNARSQSAQRFQHMLLKIHFSPHLLRFQPHPPSTPILNHILSKPNHSAMVNESPRNRRRQLRLKNSLTVIHFI